MSKRRDFILGIGLLFAVILWGANNTGTKLVVHHWPPVWTGGSRFFCAGILLLAVLRFSRLLGQLTPLTAEMSRGLWWRGGLALAVYIIVFNTALKLTSVSHVVLYLGAAPVWALLWERQSMREEGVLRKYLAALLALAGVIVLFLPALRSAHGSWPGEVLGLLAGVLWANYGRQCRHLSSKLSGVEISAHTMFRAGVLLLPIGLFEVWGSGIEFRFDVVAIQIYCIVGGGVVAFAIWSTALRHWPTSQVLLFNNLIPLSSMVWAHYWINEAITPTFWIAMLLVMAGVLLGQIKWNRPSWLRGT